MAARVGALVHSLWLGRSTRPALSPAAHESSWDREKTREPP